jgi:hypothetical protein
LRAPSFSATSGNRQTPRTQRTHPNRRQAQRERVPSERPRSRSSSVPSSVVSPSDGERRRKRRQFRFPIASPARSEAVKTSSATSIKAPPTRTKIRTWKYGRQSHLTHRRCTIDRWPIDLHAAAASAAAHESAAERKLSAHRRGKPRCTGGYEVFSAGSDPQITGERRRGAGAERDRPPPAGSPVFCRLAGRSPTAVGEFNIHSIDSVYAARFRAVHPARSPYDTVVTLHAQPTAGSVTVLAVCDLRPFSKTVKYTQTGDRHGCSSNKTHSGKQEMPVAATAAAAVDGLCISAGDVGQLRAR